MAGTLYYIYLSHNLTSIYKGQKAWRRGSTETRRPGDQELFESHRCDHAGRVCFQEGGAAAAGGAIPPDLRPPHSAVYLPPGPHPAMISFIIVNF